MGGRMQLLLRTSGHQTWMTGDKSKVERCQPLTKRGSRVPAFRMIGIDLVTHREVAHHQSTTGTPAVRIGLTMQLLRKSPDESRQEVCGDHRLAVSLRGRNVAKERTDSLSPVGT